MTTSFKSWKARLVLFFAVVGPGFITANVDNDAGGIWTYSVAGAQFGYGLLWTVFLTTPFMIAIQLVSARIGRVTGKGLKQRMFALMTPTGTEALGTSKLNFFGMGAMMLRSMMKEQGIASLEELMAMARDLGVQMTACTMSMAAMDTPSRSPSSARASSSARARERAAIKDGGGRSRSRSWARGG